MKEILNKIIKFFEPELNIFIKFKIIFKTIDNKEHESIEYFIFNQNDKAVKKIDNDLFTEMSRSDNNYNWIEYKGE